MTKKQRLELTWIGKGERPRLEPRILIEDENLSHHGARGGGIFDNVLIQGDNLLALKALEQEYAGRVKCVYIDPPFNTGQAMPNYDDGIEHSLWLSLMRERLVYLRELLASDGSMFIHIDDEEMHYLKIIVDEVFGRPNFLGTIAYERSGVSGIGQGGAFLVNTHESILAVCKDAAKYQAEDLRGGGDIGLKDMKRYNKVLVDPGTRREITRFVAPSTGEDVVIYSHSGETVASISLRNFEEREDAIVSDYVARLPKIFRTTSIQKENEFQNKIIQLCGDGLWSADYLVSRGKKGGQNTTSYFLNRGACVWLSEIASGVDGRLVRTSKLSDFWRHEDIPKADLANEGGVDFRRGKKPENLIARLLRMATRPGDLVLDSFGGSGTTGAVAHKMGRRWIMVELGDHAVTHIVPRLNKVVDGIDTGGITATAGWQGGGGYRFYRLAPSLMEKDRFGQWVIAKEYDAGRLAQAVAKHMGFTYAPSEANWWMHGSSSETDFIYVTTASLTADQLRLMSEEVGPDRTLLVACKAFHAKADGWPNLTIKRIPQMILDRCEWGRDDYSLRVASLPPAEPGPSKPTPNDLFGAAK